MTFTIAAKWSDIPYHEPTVFRLLEMATIPKRRCTWRTAVLRRITIIPFVYSRNMDTQTLIAVHVLHYYLCLDKIFTELNTDFTSFANISRFKNRKTLHDSSESVVSAR